MTKGKLPAANNPFRAVNQMNLASITVGAKVSTTINVAIQLKDAVANAIGSRGSLLAYLSNDAYGDSIATSAPSGGVAIGTNGLAIPLVTNKAFQLTSESNGTIDLNIIEASSATWYLVLVMPDGSLSVSGAITF